MLLELALEAREQREGVGGRAGEARHHAVVVELADLAGAGLDDRLSRSSPDRRHRSPPGRGGARRARSSRGTSRTTTPFSAGAARSDRSRRAPLRCARGCARVVDPHQLLGGDVRVALGGGQAAVAQQLLDHTEVGPAIEQVRGEGVAQGVRAHPPDDASRAGRASHDRVHRAHPEPTAARVREHGTGVLPAPAEPGLERLRGLGRRRARSAPCGPCRARARCARCGRASSRSRPASSETRSPLAYSSSRIATSRDARDAADGPRVDQVAPPRRSAGTTPASAAAAGPRTSRAGLAARCTPRRTRNRSQLRSGGQLAADGGRLAARARAARRASARTARASVAARPRAVAVGQEALELVEVGAVAAEGVGEAFRSTAR